MSVSYMTHPLIKHKISVLRRETTGTGEFTGNRNILTVRPSFYLIVPPASVRIVLFVSVGDVFIGKS